MPATFSPADERFMRRALQLASKACGTTSPNPMVGAVLARNGEILGEGWHKRAGEAHAEVNALAAARRKGFDPAGATIYVTLEPCSTFGRTPPCTDALLASGVARVVAGATDPNPKHAGRGYKVLRKHEVRVEHGLLAEDCERLNERFNHWIRTGLPHVTVKCAMSLDGKIATNSGESKWITGEKARAFGMRLRLGADAIVCGINTVMRDDPSLMIRQAAGVRLPRGKRFNRVILDPEARLPLNSQVAADENARDTVVAVSRCADGQRVEALAKHVRILEIPLSRDKRTLDLRALLRVLGAENVTSLLIEGGGETHATFFGQKLVQRVYFFYAPLLITGRSAPKAVAGPKTFNAGKGYRICEPEWHSVGSDLLLTGLVAS
jgi:diaminohydroxyphosphoribosylaminopyrimidine deaminase/5-amino-6-(5-phosphoribosylamino)uracil reductase